MVKGKIVRDRNAPSLHLGVEGGERGLTEGVDELCSSIKDGEERGGGGRFAGGSWGVSATRGKNRSLRKIGIQREGTFARVCSKSGLPSGETRKGKSWAVLALCPGGERNKRR